MSSSDSDDDCYGNVAKKLHSIKNTYQASDNSSMNPIGKKNLPTTNETVTNPTSVTTEDVNTSMNSTDNDELTLDAIIANNSKSRTRSRGKGKAAVEATTRATRSSRRKTIEEAQNTGNAPVPAKDITTTPTASTTSRRARGGNRGRRGSRTPRGRTRGAVRAISNYTDFLLPEIYSIGNTDEYPDTCIDQQLFAPRTDDVELVEDGDPLVDNEELSVKVYWQSLEVFKFKLRKFQKLSPIFDHFSKKENVSYDKLLLTYNDRILRVDDTPASINYNIAKFIDGGVVQQSVTRLATSGDRYIIKDGIKLKFQCQKMKKPYEVLIGPEDKLGLAMTQYAEHIETPLSRLRFYFDGDLLSGKTTAMDLELEGGECIDVKLSR